MNDHSNKTDLIQPELLNILADTPSDDDKFQSHKKISNAIGNIIRKGVGGVTIGLEGKWGSGKSTVIRLLEKDLLENKNIFFLSFDAWVHQADPLRRAFLESLISNAINKGWFFRNSNGGKLSEKWHKEKEALSKKIKVLTKNVKPVVTAFGQLLLTSLLLFPFGSLIVVNSLKPPANRGAPPIAFDWAVTSVGIFFMLLPFLIILINWLCVRNDEEKKESLFSIFYQKSHTDEISKTSESLDASTIEFQEKFDQLMSDLLEPVDTKLVIVLDNLDRLNSKEVEDVWPVLRAFLDNPKFSASPWFRRLWVLVPYAQEGLNGSLSKSNHNRDLEENDVFKAGDDSRDGYALRKKDPHFLEKIFQLKIFIPAPILSNWRLYLENLLAQAFGDDCDADKAHIIYILLTRHYGFSDPPGPRELKNIINGMVGTTYQWGFTIPLEHQAYFVLLKRDDKMSDLRAQLRNGKVNLHGDLLGENVQLSLISLECNVDPSDAAQTLFGPVIKDMLAKDIPDGELAERCQNPGFLALFDIMIGEILLEQANNDPSLFMKNIEVLCSSDFFGRRSRVKKNFLIKEISKSIANVKYLPIFLATSLESLTSLIRFDQEKLAAPSVKNVLNRTMEFFKEAGGESRLFQQSIASLEVLKNVYQLCRSNELREYLGQEFSISFYFPGDQDEFLKAYDVLKNSGELMVFDVFNLSKIHRQMLKKLEELMSKPSISEHRKLIDILKEQGEEIPLWVYQAIVSNLDPSLGRFENVVAWLPYLIQESICNKKVENQLNDLVVNGVIYYYLSVYSPSNSERNEGVAQFFSHEEKVEFCGKLLYLLLIFYPVQNSRPDVERMVKGKLIFDKIIRTPTSYFEIFRSLQIFLTRAEMLDLFLEKLDAPELLKVRSCINSFEHG